MHIDFDSQNLSINTMVKALPTNLFDFESFKQAVSEKYFSGLIAGILI